MLEVYATTMMLNFTAKNIKTVLDLLTEGGYSRLHGNWARRHSTHLPQGGLVSCHYFKFSFRNFLIFRMPAAHMISQLTDFEIFCVHIRMVYHCYLYFITVSLMVSNIIGPNILIFIQYSTVLCHCNFSDLLCKYTYM